MEKGDLEEKYNIKAITTKKITLINYLDLRFKCLRAVYCMYIYTATIYFN